MNRKTFSFKNFYFKRFKRIIPALVSSSIFTICLGYFNLSLEHFYELFRGLKYSLLFFGNVFFAQIIDYFSIDTERNLIVNLWSLGVEEQFYLVFPFVVLVGSKFKKIKISFFFSLCFFISLISYTQLFFETLYLNKVFFEFEKYLFYSPFTRTSQFLIGALAGTFKVNNLKKLTKLNFIFLFLVLFILFSKVNFNNPLIISFLGFILLINETQFSQRIFWNLLVHIGNISYSLYLFHQPILAAIRNHNFYTTQNSSNYINMESILILFGVVIFIYCVSIVNFTFVEETYRRPEKFSFSNFKFVLIMFFSVIIISNSPNIIGSLYSQNIYQLNEINDDFSLKPGTNYIRDKNNQLCIDRDNINNLCQFGKGQKKLYVLGDSTISSIVASFLTKELLQEYKIYEYTKSGCYPVIGSCSFQSGNQYFEDVTEIENSVILMGGNYNVKSMKVAELRETVEMFLSKNNKIVLLGYIPSPRFDESMYFKKNGTYLKSNNKNHQLNELLSNQSFKKEIEKSGILRYQNIEYLDIFRIFCSDSECNYFKGENFLYIDGSHLSTEGASKLFTESNLAEVLDY